MSAHKSDLGREGQHAFESCADPIDAAVAADIKKP